MMFTSGNGFGISVCELFCLGGTMVRIDCIARYIQL